MQIDPPLRSLKEKCPCCSGEGMLDLCACSNCSKVIAACDLAATIFIDPLHIRLTDISGKRPGECPFCGIFNGLTRAKDYEIISWGLTTNEYEKPNLN